MPQQSTAWFPLCPVLVWPWRGGWCISAPGWAQGCRLRPLPTGGSKEWNARLAQPQVCRGSPTSVLSDLLCKWEKSHHLIRLSKGCFFLWEKHFGLKKEEGTHVYVCIYIYIYTYICIHKWQRVLAVYIVIILFDFFFLWLWLHRQNKLYADFLQKLAALGNNTDGCQPLMVTAADYLAILWTPFSALRRACPGCYPHGYGQMP